VLFWFTNKMILDDLYDDDDVNGLRLCLWTVATNRSFVHPPGDI
jgi:hypothetical protein